LKRPAIVAPSNGGKVVIQIISAQNRRLFHHALIEMHRQRRELFIEGMGWNLKAEAGLEIDRFDSADAIYLIETDEQGAVTQSARLLPTLRPHLLSEIFPHLCTDGPPCSERIWEATRFCPAPQTPKGAPRRTALARMIAAIMETAILFGVEEVSFVAGAALAPLARNAGWEVRALGPLTRIGRERLVAMSAAIDSAGLARVRALNGLTGPLTRYADAEFRRAA
jgi:N-acyl-L-homoserine lactone synthetase